MAFFEIPCFVEEVGRLLVDMIDGRIDGWMDGRWMVDGDGCSYKEERGLIGNE